MKQSFRSQAFKNRDEFLHFYCSVAHGIFYVFLHWFSQMAIEAWISKKQHCSNKHWKKEKFQCIPAFGSKSANALIFHDIDTPMLNMFEFCAWHKSEFLSNFQEIESHPRKHRILWYEIEFSSYQTQLLLQWSRKQTIEKKRYTQTFNQYYYYQMYGKWHIDIFVTNIHSHVMIKIHLFAEQK